MPDGWLTINYVIRLTVYVAAAAACENSRPAAQLKGI